MQKITDILRKKLTILMETRNLRGYELAEMADIHPVTISKILNNRMPQVSLDIVHKLALALGVTIEDLTGEKSLYPKQDQKIMVLRDQFEKYGYDSIDTIIEMIPTLSSRIKEAKTLGQSTDEQLQQQQSRLQKRFGTLKNKKTA
jgi:transcriptional regulator with XRE-family HTH domain